MIECVDEYFAFDSALLGRVPTLVEVGVFTLGREDFLTRRYPLARYHAVEPDPQNFAALAAAISAQKHYWVQAHPLALAERDGETTLYEYGHEQLSTVFPRHLAEGVRLRHSVRVRGLTLRSLLDELGVARCHLLLLNCEGAEIFAMRQLADDKALRARVKQFCTSSHCEHIRCYPKQQWQDAMQALESHYDVTRCKFEPIPYYLFTRKPGGRGQ